MRILLLTGNMEVSAGGPPRVVAGSAAALAQRGHTVDIAGLSKRKHATEQILAAFPELRQPNISIELHSPSKPTILGASRALLKDLKGRISDYDAVHMHGIWERCLADTAALASKANVPIFVSAHGMLDVWSMQQSRWKKQLAMRFLGTKTMLTNAKAVIYGTEDELLESRRSVPYTTGAVVPNGIDIDRLTLANLPEMSSLANRFPQINEWKRTILFFSRVHPKKGLSLLVEAFLEHAPAHPDAGLFIAGIAQDQNYEDEIRLRIATSNMADRVVFTTDLSGPNARIVFRKADIFALPSHQEGLSIAILEAMAFGKPLLITSRCHLPAVAENWRCGLVAKDDRDGISLALGKLLAQPETELREMGARGRQAVIENFSWDSVAMRLEALYGSVDR